MLSMAIALENRSREAETTSGGEKGELFGTSIGEPTMGDDEVVSASWDR